MTDSIVDRTDLENAWWALLPTQNLLHLGALCQLVGSLVFLLLSLSARPIEPRVYQATLPICVLIAIWFLATLTSLALGFPFAWSGLSFPCFLIGVLLAPPSIDMIRKALLSVAYASLALFPLYILSLPLLGSATADWSARRYTTFLPALTADESGGYEPGRFVGFFGDPNQAGFLFAFSAIIAIYWSRTVRASTVLIVLSLVGLVFTESRVAIVGFLLSLLLLFAARRFTTSDNRRRALVYPLAWVLSVAVVAATLQHLVPQLNGRTSLWLQTLRVNQEILREWPSGLLCGFTNVSCISEAWSTVSPQTQLVPGIMAHNSLLELAATSGLVGACLTVLAVLYVFTVQFKSFSVGEGTTCALVFLVSAYLFANNTLHWSLLSLPALIFMLLILMQQSLIRNQQPSST